MALLLNEELQKCRHLLKQFFDSGKPGKTVALMGEYDCLPEIGHGCGHNLIGTSAAGAGNCIKGSYGKA